MADEVGEDLCLRLLALRGFIFETSGFQMHRPFAGVGLAGNDLLLEHTPVRTWANHLLPRFVKEATRPPCIKFASEGLKDDRYGA